MALDSKPVIAETGEASRFQAGSQGEGQATLALEGMTCASCAMRIEKGLKKVPGVKDASVNLATERASVTYDPARTNVEQMVQKVEAVGYKATPQVAPRQEMMPTGIENDASAPPVAPTGNLAQQDEQSSRKQAEFARKRNLLVLGIALSLPVVILSMFFMN